MAQISVIVPVYNVEPYLCRCVDSILDQSFADFELILVDDGSPDNCGAICDEYAARDSRVVVIHQKNGGLSAARNAGIDWIFENSDSQWLTFIDSDDWVHREYLERLLGAALTHRVDVSTCGYVRTDGAAPAAEGLPFELWEAEKLYVDRGENANIACAKLYRRTCFQNVRYPVGKLHEDEFVTYTILFPARHIAVTEDVLYYYYTNGQGITKSPWKIQRLHGLEAIERQIAYMKEYHFETAYEHAHKKYMVCLAEHIYHLQLEERIIRVKYLPKLRWKLRRMLLRYHGLVSSERYPRIYESAFPWATNAFWIAKAQVLKIRRKFK